MALAAKVHRHARRTALTQAVSCFGMQQMLQQRQCVAIWVKLSDAGCLA
ncbi:MAG: hypothetical protein HYV96_17805 [Opitutae bacterium]|nr:hypothetical protein [Opitutae bacterium]